MLSRVGPDAFEKRWKQAEDCYTIFYNIMRSKPPNHSSGALFRSNHIEPHRAEILKRFVNVSYVKAEHYDMRTINEPPWIRRGSSGAVWIWRNVLWMFSGPRGTYSRTTILFSGPWGTHSCSWILFSGPRGTYSCSWIFFNHRQPPILHNQWTTGDTIMLVNQM